MLLRQISAALTHRDLRTDGGDVLISTSGLEAVASLHGNVGRRRPVKIRHRDVAAASGWASDLVSSGWYKLSAVPKLLRSLKVQITFSLPQLQAALHAKHFSVDVVGSSSDDDMSEKV